MTDWPRRDGDCTTAPSTNAPSALPGGDLTGLAVGLALLPVRLAGLGFSVLRGALVELDRRAPLLARPRVAAPATFNIQPPAPVPSGPVWPTSPGASSAFPPPNPATAGGAGSPAPGRVVPTTTPKEDRIMDDRNVGGSDLKVVEYSILSVKPEMKDEKRIYTGPRLVSFSDDMTPEDFVTWVVAMYVQKHPEKVHHKDKKYLRVCWRVLCRFAIDDPDYERDQAKSLQEISDTLKRRVVHVQQVDDDDSSSSAGGSSAGGPAAKARGGKKS